MALQHRELDALFHLTLQSTPKIPPVFMGIHSNIFPVSVMSGQGLPRGAVTCGRVYGAGFSLVAFWAWPFSWQLLETKDALKDFILDL